MQKKQKREEQTNELLQKQFKAIQDILNKEGIPDVVRAQLLDRFYGQTKELISNELYDKVLSNAALLFNLLKYLGCKDGKKYLSLSRSNWDVLNDFSEEMWNELIDGIDVPEFARWGPLEHEKVGFLTDNDAWDRLMRCNKNMLFVGQVTNVQIQYLAPAYNVLLPVRITKVDDQGETSECELLEIGEGDTYRYVSGAKKGEVVIITSVDVNELTNLERLQITIRFSSPSGPTDEFNEPLKTFLTNLTFVQASNKERTKIPLYGMFNRYRFDLSPPVWTDRYGVTRSYGGYSYFYTRLKLLFLEAIKYKKGDIVFTNLERWLEYQPSKGEIVAVNKPDSAVKKGVKEVTYTIDFKDGNKEEGVKGSEIMYSDSKTYKLRKLATRWYVKCIYKHRIHDKVANWNRNADGIDRLLNGELSKIRQKWILYFKRVKLGEHVIQFSKPPEWMGAFFNTEKIYSDDIKNNFAKSEIKSVRLSHMKMIGDDAFNDCPIEDLYLPMVEEIGDRAFENCPIEGTRYPPPVALTPILDLPNVKQIGANAFKIPNKKKIGDNTVEFPFITKLSLPKVKWIFDDALNRAKLEKLELPEVREIGKNFLNEGSIDFLAGTDVYDIHWPKIRKLGRGFLSGMQGGVVPLPYEFLLENPYAYLDGIDGKPVQWVDKTMKEVVCIQLDWVFASESLHLHINVLNRYHQPLGILKAIKKTILDDLRKTYGETYGGNNRRDPEVSTRSDTLPYFFQTLFISVKGKIDPEKFGEDMCSLLGKKRACKLERVTEDTWNALMVYKGSGGSSSDNNRVDRMMMMSLKF